MTGLVPVHVPARHMSAFEQASLSSHAIPSDLTGNEQMPLAGLQAPVV